MHNKTDAITYLFSSIEIRNRLMYYFWKLCPSQNAQVALECMHVLGASDQAMEHALGCVWCMRCECVSLSLRALKCMVIV